MFTPFCQYIHIIDITQLVFFFLFCLFLIGSDMYRHLIIKPSHIKWKLNNVRCPKHKTRKKKCKIIVNKDNPTKTIIYDRFENYEVSNYKIFCSDIPSRPSTILQFAPRLILSNNSDDYITVENQKVYKVKSIYIVSTLLFYFNDSTINGNLKMIGIFFDFLLILTLIYH